MTTKYPAAIILALSALLPACERSKDTHTVGNSGAPSASLTKVAGLSLALAGQPQKAEFGLSKSSKENTASQDSYVMQSGSTQYGLCQTVHHTMNDSLDDNAHGIVDGHTGYSIVDMQVAGVSGKRITMEFSANQNTQYLSIILFSKDKTLWQIATIDPSMPKAHAAMDALIPTIVISE